MTRRLLGTILVVLSLQGTVASAHHEPAEYRRGYFLGDRGDYLWWSFDPLEDDATVRLVERRCPEVVYTGGKPCLSGGVQPRIHTLWFNPRSHPLEPVMWSSAKPIRFHVGLEIDSPVPNPTVRFVYYDGMSLGSSDPATQVSPGVWEGALASGSWLDVNERGQFGVQVSYSGEGPSILRMRTDGSSWFELPEPVEGRSLSDIKRLSPDTPQPAAYTTPRKSFRFNDADWEVRTFQGDLSQERSFTHTLPRDAAAVFGWVETGRDVLVARAARGDVDTESYNLYSNVAFFRDGEMLDFGEGFDEGGDTAALSGLEAGPLEMRVRIQGEGSNPPSYTGYLLVVYGERTLQSLRTEFAVTSAARVPLIGLCPGVRQPIPVTPTVRAFRMQIDWDGVTPNQKWAPRYGLPEGDLPCSEGGTGDEVTLVNAPLETFWFGATAAHDSTMASYRDVVISAEIRYWHEPPPHPEEEPQP